MDDLDGSSADETVEFVTDNFAYEIDLSHAHTAALRAALTPYITAARRAPSGAARPPRARTASTSTSTERHQHSNAIRSWARQNGYPIAERGCIPVEIIEAYEKNADSGPAPSPFATSATSAPQFQEAG